MLKKSLVCVLLLFTFSIVIAHPASKIKLDFDTETKLLDIRFDHKVADPEKHFIYKIEIELNGKDVIEQNLSLQDTKTGGSLVYKLADAIAGDKIKVMLRCNKSGNKSKTLTIKSESQE